LSHVRKNETDLLITDAACLDPIYADGIGGATNLGSNFGTIYFRWVPMRSESGLLVYEKAPALYVVMPKTSILTPNGVLARMIEGPEPAPRRMAMVANH
jgi:hypothetical protein